VIIDTHCHIHESDYPLDREETVNFAHENGVEKMICVGTSIKSSFDAIEFVGSHDTVFASIGVHPHESKDGYKKIGELVGSDKLVAVGEIGLDYYYDHSPRDVQIEALKWQIDLALSNNLPIIFHIRDAFDDFWPIFDSFKDIRGVLHSFTDNQANLDKCLSRGLYVGVNGISTFTKDDAQKELFNSIPLDRLLLETDSPFLAPAPNRGKTNQPAYARDVALYHAQARGISYEEIAQATTLNANTLFSLKN
jgi:TatD DNase family protein